MHFENKVQPCTNGTVYVFTSVLSLLDFCGVLKIWIIINFYPLMIFFLPGPSFQLKKVCLKQEQLPFMLCRADVLMMLVIVLLLLQEMNVPGPSNNCCENTVRYSKALLPVSILSLWYKMPWSRNTPQQIELLDLMFSTQEFGMVHELKVKG